MRMRVCMRVSVRACALRVLVLVLSLVAFMRIPWVLRTPARLAWSSFSQNISTIRTLSAFPALVMVYVGEGGGWVGVWAV